MRTIALGGVGLLIAMSTWGCGDNTATGPTRCGPGTIVDPAGHQCIGDDSSAGGTGGSNEPLACGEGTFELDGECVGFDPNDDTTPNTSVDPPSGKFFALPFVTLTTDEPATIFYTTDGSEPTTASTAEPLQAVIQPLDGVPVRYFAVDLAGNAEAVKAHTYDLDNFAPAPVADLSVTPNGAELEVTWSHPVDADFAGVVLVRQREQPVIARTPAAGSSFVVGDAIDGAEVVYVGGDESFFDTTAVLGATYSYAAFAYDDIGNFSAQAGPVQNGLRLAAQTAQLSIADPDGTPVVTIVNQPANLTLGATATFTTGSLTIDLSVDNNAATTIHSGKAVVTATNLGTLVADGTLGANTFKRIGSGFGIAQGGSANTALVFTGVDAAQDPMLVDLTIAHDTTLFMGTLSRDSGTAAQLFDTATSEFTATIGCDGALFDGNQGQRCSLRDPVMSLDGRFLYGGSSHTPHVKQFDLTTGSLVQTLALDSGDGTVQGVVMSPDGGTLFATHGRLCPGGDRGFGGVDLVQIDTATLAETDRLVLHGAGGFSSYGIALSPDGKTLAVTTSDVFDQSVPNANFVHLIDVATLTVIDTNALEGGVQSLDPLVPRARHPQFHGNSTLFFSQREASGGSVASVDLTALMAGEPTAIEVLTGASASPGRAKTGADGRVWTVLGSSVEAHDGATMTSLVLDGGETGPASNVSVFSVDGATVWVTSVNGIVTIDTASVTEIGSFGAPLTPRMHWMVRSPL